MPGDHRSSVSGYRRRSGRLLGLRRELPVIGIQVFATGMVREVSGNTRKAWMKGAEKERFRGPAR